MNRNFGVAAWAAGLVSVVWIGFGYAGAHPLALAMTVLIAAFYLMGGLELHRFHQATVSLASALAAIPGPGQPQPPLGDWLARVPPALRTPVRLRIEGERVGLPGPAMVPYLVGLLVLLGMLGTFLGMVVTLKGAVIALESTTDLPTIRAALAAPVKGLGLAFGTSVAGVAASAMLGLVSALCRRERLQAAQALDTLIAGPLRIYSLAYQREATLETLQAQSRQMPEVVGQLQALMAQLDRQNQTLNERLLASQDGFYRHSRTAYEALAESVDRSLKTSLTESARVASTTMQPLVEATMRGLARDAAAVQAGLVDVVKTQLDGLSDRFGATVGTVSEVWTTALDRHERSSHALTTALQASLQQVTGSFTQGAASLLAAVNDAQAARLAEQTAQDQQRLDAWTRSLEAMAAALQHEWQQAGAATLTQQQEICRTLEQTAQDTQTRAEAHARSTITELGALMETAAEAPKAAAEVVRLLRERLSDSLARDNVLLEERSRIMGSLGSLLQTMQQAATEQREAIDTLVTSSAAVLAQAGAGFAAQVEAESGRISGVAAQITGSAVEVASLGEAFGHAVQLFSQSNETLVAHLQRIEAALDKSTARSDEQLAYYVAQAREIIDLSISSQRQIVDDLQQLAARPVPLTGEAA